MNTVRIRAKVKELHQMGALTSEQLHMALHAPLFEWQPGSRQSYTEQESQFIREQLCPKVNVPITSPFTCFLLHFIGSPESDTRLHIWFFLEKSNMWKLIRVEKSQHEEHVICLDMNYWDTDARIRLVIFENGKRVPAEITSERAKRADMKPWVYDVADSLRDFVFDVMSPANTVITAAPPKKNGKSVEWTLARTHYLILNRKQAEGIRKTRNAPTDHQIKRAAHWRRAHFRRLVSEKFTPEKRGKLIPVCHAWVGPKEWEGLDGKVYKVVDIPNGTQKV